MRTTIASALLIALFSIFVADSTGDIIGYPVGGMCPYGTTLQTISTCWSSTYGDMGTPVNGMCPTGFTVKRVQVCATPTPANQCLGVAVGGMCPTGFTLRGNLCC